MWFILLIIIIKSLEYFFKNNLDLNQLTFKYVNVWVKNDSDPNQVKINYNDVKRFKNEVIIPDKFNLIQRYILKLKINLIEIFKRTGSIHKLQRAMGHSSLNVSLTYLRGLEVAELEESDMPMF
jgi:hypothetical protein